MFCIKLFHIVKKHIIEHNDFANVDEALEVIKDVLNNGSVSRENADKVMNSLLKCNINRLYFLFIKEL